MGVNCVGKLCKNPIHFVCIFIVQRFFWPKISKINGAQLKLFMHMKTHCSSISSYQDLSINNFLKLTSLISMPQKAGVRVYNVLMWHQVSLGLRYQLVRLQKACMAHVVTLIFHKEGLRGFFTQKADYPHESLGARHVTMSFFINPISLLLCCMSICPFRCPSLASRRAVWIFYPKNGFLVKFQIGWMGLAQVDGSRTVKQLILSKYAPHPELWFHQNPELIRVNGTL